MLEHITWRLMTIKRFVIQKDRWCRAQLLSRVFISILSAAAVIIQERCDDHYSIFSQLIERHDCGV